MPKNPKVSILVPTYNYAHYLDEAIKSALNQSYTDFELIIVDDNSTDNTDDVVLKYLTDARITYYKNPVNIGLSNNFNKCLDLAKGEYIKYLLADDRLHPQLLEKFVTIMDRDPSIALITSNSEMFGTNSKVRVQPFKHLQSGKKIINESLKENNGNWIGEPTVIMFRKTALKAHHFDNNYTCLVDWDLWLKLLTEGDCYIVPETLSYFRSHDKQASQKVLNNFNYTFEEYYFYKNIQQKNPYKADVDMLNINGIVKKRAVFCGDAMFKLIPSLKNKKQRKVFGKAFKIASSEKVIMKSFYKLLKGLYKKTTSRSTQAEIAFNN